MPTNTLKAKLRTSLSPGSNSDSDSSRTVRPRVTQAGPHNGSTSSESSSHISNGSSVPLLSSGALDNYPSYGSTHHRHHRQPSLAYQRRDQPPSLLAAAGALNARLVSAGASVSGGSLPTFDMSRDELTPAIFLLRRRTIGSQSRRREEERAVDQVLLGGLMDMLLKEDVRRKEEHPHHLLHFSEEGDGPEGLAPLLIQAWDPENGSNQCVDALDLLLLPSAPHAASILAHPAIDDAVGVLWTAGVTRPSRSSASLRRRFLGLLDSSCTPRCLHALAVASRFGFLALTLSILLVPTDYMTSNPEGRPRHWRVNWRDCLWIIMSVGHLLEPSDESFLSSRTLPLFAFSVASISFLRMTTLAYPLLTISLPFLFFAPTTPSGPSLIYLSYPSPTLLPLSIGFYRHLLPRLARATLLFLPLLILVFAALALALNGDIWRLGFQAVVFFSPEACFPPDSFSSLEGPEETGVSPFGARLWLAVTLAMMLAATLLLCCSRLQETSFARNLSLLPSPLSTLSSTTTDPWEIDYGSTIAFDARKHRIRTLKRYLVDLISPPPNLADFAASVTSSAVGSTESLHPHHHQPPSLTAHEGHHESRPLLLGPSSAPSTSFTTASPAERGFSVVYPSPSPSPFFYPPSTASATHLPLPSPLNVLPFVFSTMPTKALEWLPDHLTGMDESARAVVARTWQRRSGRRWWRLLMVMSLGIVVGLDRTMR